MTTKQLGTGLDLGAVFPSGYTLRFGSIRIYRITGVPLYGCGWCEPRAEGGSGLYAGLFVYVIVTSIGCHRVKISVLLSFFQRSCHLVSLVPPAVWLLRVWLPGGSLLSLWLASVPCLWLVSVLLILIGLVASGSVWVISGFCTSGLIILFILFILSYSVTALFGMPLFSRLATPMFGMPLGGYS